MDRVRNPLARTAALAAAAIPVVLALGAGAAQAKQYKHVLILSVDGLRQADVSDPLLQTDLPNLIALEKGGISYTNAQTSKPSDSFPGTLAYLTGAGPAQTGVYYDDSYSRTLTAPGGTASTPRGTQVLFDESIDKNPDILSGGGNFGAGDINPAALPLDFNKGGGGAPVYPWQYVKVNNIFSVAHDAGLLTAFSDKHAGAYTLAFGPKGNAVDEYYSPEVTAKVALVNGKLVDATDAPAGTTLTTVTKSTTLTEAYDDLKVKAIINEIKGQKPTGGGNPGVPAVFAMNFQEVSVAEKALAGGIDLLNGKEVPSAQLNSALSHTDASIGQIVDALKQQGLFNDTLVVVTAKHGQNPRIGSAKIVDPNVVSDTLAAAGIQVAQVTQDDVALVWLKNRSQDQAAVTALQALKNGANPIGISQILDPSQLKSLGLSDGSDRTPDLILKLKPGYVINDAPSKRAEHGGLNPDDVNVPIILSSGAFDSSLAGSQFTGPVKTTQIAVTALDALGLNPNALDGARAAGTQVLPGAGITGPAVVPLPAAVAMFPLAAAVAGICAKRLRRTLA